MEDPFTRCCDPLKGKRLRVAYNGVIPIIFRPESGNKFDQSVTGVDIDVMKIVADVLGFQVIFQLENFDVKIFGRWTGKIAVVIMPDTRNCCCYVGKMSKIEAQKPEMAIINLFSNLFSKQ